MQTAAVPSFSTNALSRTEATATLAQAQPMNVFAQQAVKNYNTYIGSDKVSDPALMASLENASKGVVMEPGPVDPVMEEIKKDIWDLALDPLTYLQFLSYAPRMFPPHVVRVLARLPEMIVSDARMASYTLNSALRR
eukprot:jgi/Mesvir1/12680/Mv01679-RA.1